MSILGRLPAILNEVGITAKQLDHALAEDVGVREAVIAKTKQVQQFWVSIAAESDRREHAIMKGSDEIIHPGDYKKSIKYSFKKEADGSIVGIVKVDEKIAPHAKWIIYGSIHNTASHDDVKVTDHFQGVETA